MNRIFSAWLWRGICLLLVGFAPAALGDGGLSLRWEIESHRYSSTEARGSTHALLRLHNGDTALPAEGWALYFNCAAELVVGDLAGHLRAEHVGGTLYRIRPEPGFPGLSADADLVIGIEIGRAHV